MMNVKMIKRSHSHIKCQNAANVEYQTVSMTFDSGMTNV